MSLEETAIPYFLIPTISTNNMVDGEHVM